MEVIQMARSKLYEVVLGVPISRAMNEQLLEQRERTGIPIAIWARNLLRDALTASASAKSETQER